MKEGICIGPQIRGLTQDKQFDKTLNETERNAWLSFKRICKDFLGNHKAANYQDVLQDLLTSYKAMGCNRSLKIHFLDSHLDIFPRKSRRSQWRTRWQMSPRHYGYGKAESRQVDPKYVGRLLLDTEEGCTWRQIPAKVICLYILEERFCLFREHVKYYFVHLNFSVTLKPCLIEKFCIHSWIRHKKVLLSSSTEVTVTTKKVKFCWPVLFTYRNPPKKRCCTESCMQQDEKEDQKWDGWMTCPRTWERWE